ncbi:gluconeogenesis factor [Lachnospiraceae bacterium]|nr:gluconeogenesis factor [Lachnospiraceae bacterium]
MYNIVVFSGGTGSIAIQEGFSAIYGNDNYNLDIIINAYDNGKSTGFCRKVFDSKILGPSDLRKNHMTQFKIQHSAELKDFSSRESVIYRMFNLRMDAASKENYYNKGCELLEKSRDAVGDKDTYYLKSLLDFFFFENIRNNVWRKTVGNVRFDDFSIANVFYSSAAAMNGNSLRLAGKDMAAVLGIKDNVHLISDVNLYLEAKTESGHIIADEGEIVEWDNPDDKIESVMLLKDGKEYVPTVDEETDLTKVRSIKDIVEKADIMIFSSGTQWSSLIPSYMHSGLRRLLAASRAKKYVVINNVEDRDMKGISADGIIEILGRYIPVEDITAVVNEDAMPGINQVSGIRCISGHIGGEKAKHNPVRLISLIMKDYFDVKDTRATFVYDLDGTLWDERVNNIGKAVGAENMNLFSGMIHSGNDYEHVRDVFKYLYHRDELVQIYSDFGNVHFTSEDDKTDLLLETYIVDSEVVRELEKINEFKHKIKIRGQGCVVTMKPLVNREALLRKAAECLEKFDGVYVARISGYTSIDVMHKDYGKKTMLKEIMEKNGLDINHVIFVGNETIVGAEADIAELGVRTIQVDDVYECNILLKTLRQD